MAAPRKSRRAAVFCLILGIFAILPSVNVGHGHSHDHHGHSHDHHGHSHDHHGHSHEPVPPHAKYSREANQPVEEKHHDHQHEHLGHAHEEPKEASQSSWRQKDTGLLLWAKAVGSTFLISVAPVFILLFIPLDNTDEDSPLLKVLLSFASGGLLGDAFLHLIPHALSPHSHSGDDHGHGHSHDHGHSHGEGGHDHSADMRVGLWVLSGLIAFLMVEKLVKFLKGGEGHEHSHSPKHVAKKEEEKNEKSDAVRKRKTSDKDASDKDASEKTEDSKVVEKHEDIKVAGYLNLAADFTHNFTDGLAIGASYLAGNSIGVITTITVLIHEVPHEVGDFAILVQSGCSKKKAMMLQFSTALGAMAGTVVSLLAEGAGEAATIWILPFTAGGFIYIATVSVIPELLEEAKLWQTIKEIVAMIIGVLMMVLIAYVE